MEIPRFRRHAPDEASKPTPAPPDIAPSAQESAERLKQRINPVVARIVASTEDKRLLQPQYKIATSQEISNLGGQLTNKKPEDISYTAVEALSEDKREEYYKKKAQREEKAAEQEGKVYKPKTFEEKKKDWNDSVAVLIKKKITPNTDKRDDVLAVLKSANIAIDEHTTDDELHEKINDFYDSYLNGKSNIKKFVADVAKDCRTGEAIWQNQDNDMPIKIVGNVEKDSDGKEYVKTESGTPVPLEEVLFPVDRDTLQARLTAVKGLLSSFGNTDGIPELVQDYATAHGELSQKKEERVKTIATIKPHLTTEVSTGHEKDRLQALYKKEQELTTGPHRIFPDADRAADKDNERTFVSSAGAESKKDVDKGVPNQDSFFSNPEKGAFGVFDGLGSYPRSDEASQLASKRVADAFAQIPADLPVDEAKEKVTEAFSEANEAIRKNIEARFQKIKTDIERNLAGQLSDEEFEEIYKDEKDKLIRAYPRFFKTTHSTPDEYLERIRQKASIATTAAAVKILQEPGGERKAIIAHVGDSRIYRMRNGTLECLTLDDTSLNEILPPSEAQYIQDEKDKRPDGHIWKKKYLEGKMITLYENNPFHIYAWDNSYGFSKKYPFVNAKVEVPLGEVDDYAIAALPEKQVNPTVMSIDIQPGDRLLLTSDGIHDGPTSVRLQEILTDPANKDPKKAAQALVAEGQQENGDDATAVVVNI